MLVKAPCVVSLTWRIEDTVGNLIDELLQPLEFFVGGDDLLTKIEEALIGQQAGFETWLQLEPEHAFGDYDAKLVFFEDRAVFPDKVDVGMQFDGLPPVCTTREVPPDATYTVTEAYPTHVVLDGNHPLAGRALRLNVLIRDVRLATPAEITRGSVVEAELTVLDMVPGNPQLH